jgi:hypothetical protein
VVRSGYWSLNSRSFQLGDSYESRLGLKRRAGTLSRTNFFDFDDSRDEEEEEEVPGTDDPLAKFRSLYDSNKNKSGVPDSMPPDGVDYDMIYTQAKSQARATADTSGSQMDLDDDDEDGFLQHLRNQRAKEKKKTLRIIEEDASEEDEAVGPSHATQGTNPAARSQSHEAEPEEFRTTQKSLPTLPENVSKDETFLKTASKVKRGNHKVDEFDLEFNALKISKPTKSNPVNPTITVNKAKQTDEELYRLLEDMDTSTTGNFIVIERVDLYRKDKGQGQAPQGPNPEWAGKKNFKKFKKV